MKSNIYRIQVLKDDETTIITVENKKTVKEFFYTNLSELKASLVDGGFNIIVSERLTKAIGYMLNSGLDYQVLSIKSR